MKFRYRVLLKSSTVTGQQLIDAAKAVLKPDEFHSEVSVRTESGDLFSVGRVDPASNDFVIAVGDNFRPEIDPQKSYSVVSICSYVFENGHDWVNHKPLMLNDRDRQEIAHTFAHDLQQYLNA